MTLDLRCSVQSRERGADPIGSAGTYEGFLLIEVPLPWPAEITDHDALTEFVPLVEAGWRIQGVVPDGADRPVVRYRKPPGPFRRYEHDGDDVTDVLVCTHGRRDRCCGSLGTALYSEVRHRFDGVRVSRVSHTGGHRFAPTAIVLPFGHVWAWLDGELLAAIIERSRHPRELLGHYRGCTGIGPAPVQAVERELFAEIGWSWVDHAREGHMIDQPADDRWHIRFDHTAPDGMRRVHEAVVVSDGLMPQPICGEPPGTEKKADHQYRVAELTALP